MPSLSLQLSNRLENRRNNNSLRGLPELSEKIDFSSNDYLGLAGNIELQNKIVEAFSRFKHGHGSGGSRLISGNHSLFEETESYLQEFHQGESALIFNSGYDANIGFYSTIPKRGDTILYDELIHASIRDGIKLSNAHSYNFLHNDMADLENKLQRSKGNLFIGVESIYSMDGDEVPLNLIGELAEKYKAYLIVDEAHSTGIYGKQGEGLTASLNLNQKVFARLHTFGKAMGCHGAVWIVDKNVREYLINFCRAFIYTTALPPFALYSIFQSYLYVQSHPELISKLQNNIHYFNEKVQSLHIPGFISSNSPIQSVIIPGNEQVKTISSTLQNEGFQVVPILHPTVKQGSERIRLSLHQFNTNQEIDDLLSVLHKSLGCQ